MYLYTGCAFAVFTKQKDALAAQIALNNIKIMPGVSDNWTKIIIVPFQFYVWLSV